MRVGVFLWAIRAIARAAFYFFSVGICWEIFGTEGKNKQFKKVHKKNGIYKSTDENHVGFVGLFYHFLLNWRIARYRLLLGENL